MLQPILLILLLVIIIGVFVYMTYRDNARRAKSKKRNQYNDRV
jgi:preprotein translocase subunit YajC